MRVAVRDWWTLAARHRVAVALVAALLLPALLPPASSTVAGAVSVSSVDELLALGVTTGSGTEDDPWVIRGLVVTEPNETAISITGLGDRHLVLRDVNATGKVGLYVSGVKHLTIQNLTASGVEAVVLQDIKELKVDRIEASAVDSAIVVGDVEKGFMKDLRVRRASDGLVLSNYTGSVVLGDFRVDDNGVVADEFRGWMQNMIVQGACVGAGLTFSGGNPNLLGNAAHCSEAGIRIESATNATLNGDAVAFADHGIVVRGTRLQAKGVVVKAVEGVGIDVEGANATIEGALVTGARTGISLRDGAFILMRNTVTDVEEDAVRVELARLCESGGVYSLARAGMRLSAVDGVVAGNCGSGTVLGGGPPLPPTGTTTVSDAETGIHLETTVLDVGTLKVRDLWGDGAAVRAGFGVSNGTFPWQSVEVEHLASDHRGTAFDLSLGADLGVKKVDLQGLERAGRLGSGARLTITEGGEVGDREPLDGGFRVMDRAYLSTRWVNAYSLKRPFVDANDSTVRDISSSIAAITVNGVEPRVADEVFRLIRVDVSLDGTVIQKGRVGIYLEGLLDVEEGELRPAAKFNNVNVAYNRRGGIHLVDTAAHISGGRIEYSGERGSLFFAKPPADTAHGVLVERSGVVIDGNVRIQYNDGDGIRWDGGTTVPESTLFPPGANGKSATVPSIGRSIVNGNIGNGLYARDVAAGLGFVIDGASLTANRGSGADLRDVNVQIRNTVLDENDRHGLRSEWTRATVDEVFEVRRSNFGRGCCGGNTLNGLDLTGHGEATRIINNVFNDTGTNLGQLLPEASYGHHIALWNSTRGAGPLILNNWLDDAYYCSIKLTAANARIHENSIRSVISGSGGYNGFTCGLHANRVQSYEFEDNRLGVSGLGVLSRNSSGTIRGNHMNATGAGLAWIEGDGTQTVRLLDNSVVSGTRAVGTPRYATDMYASPCETGSLAPMVCWSNVQGEIGYNDLDGGSSNTESRCPKDPEGTVECRLGGSTKMILILRGPATPEIHHNKITTKGFGIELWAPSGSTDRSLSAGQWYDGANRIHDNVFDTYFAAGDTTTRATAIRDQHGSYTNPGSGAVHNPPLGADVSGNTFAKGIYVECHYSEYNWETSQWVLDTRYACSPDGRQIVSSHTFGGTASGTAGPRAATPYQDLFTREKLPSDLKTHVRDAPSVDRGFKIEPPTLSVERTGGVRTFELRGVATWAEGGFSYGTMRDSEADILIQFLADGAVIHSVAASDASPYGVEIRHADVSFTWQAPAEKLYEITLRVSIDSKTKDPKLGHQTLEAKQKAWAGTGPHMLGIESNRGTVFIQAIPIPGGVQLKANVLWGAADTGTGYVVFKYAGKDRRAFGKSPSIVVQPPLDFTSPVGDIVSVEAEAFMKENSERSNAVALRLKIIPFPLAVLGYLAPGESEVNFGAEENGARTVQYKWEIVFPTFDKDFETSVPGIAGKFEAKAGGGIKIIADTAGGGSIGPQGSVKLAGRSANNRYDFEFAGKIDGSGVVQVDDVEFKGIVLVVKIEGDAFAYLLVSDFVPAVKSLTVIPFLGKYADVDRYLRVGMGLGLETEGGWQLEGNNKDSCARVEGWKCTGTLNIKPRITLKLTGQLSKDLSAELYGKGSLYFTIVSPPPDDPTAAKRPFGLKEMGLEGEVGLTAKVYSYEKQWKTVWSTKFQSPGKAFNVTTETDWAIPPRTWTTGGDLDVEGDAVLRNLTGDARPAIAFSDGTALAAWVRDDLGEAWPRSGEIALAARAANGQWTALGSLTDNALADASPSVAPLAGGKWLVTWVRNMDATLSTTTPLSADTGKPYAVAAAVVDPAAPLGAGALLAGTDDGVLDHDARALSAADGSGLVVWTKNAGNSLSPTETTPDAVWAARVVNGALGAPVLAFPADVARARAFAWDGAKLWMAAQRDDGAVVLASSDLAGARTEVPVGAAGEAPPALALAVDGTSRRVAWLAPNATDPNAVAHLVETTIPAAGSAVTRTIAPAAPDALEYAAGARALLWTGAHGDGSALWSARADAARAWAAPEILATTLDDVKVLAAAPRGDGFEVATSATKITTRTETVDYTGPNVETPAETITVRHNVTSVERGERSLRVATVAPPPPAAPLDRLETREVFAEPGADGVVRLRALVANPGANRTGARDAEFRLAPVGGGPGVTVATRIPALRNETTGEAVAAVAVPAGASGAWSAMLVADELTSGNAVVRFAPDWRLPQGNVTRTGRDISFVLENAGPRGGSTRVLALPFGAAGLEQASVASAALEVPAFGSRAGRMTLPAGTGPVLLVANPPDDAGIFDQAHVGSSVALAEGDTPVSGFLGTVVVPAGATPFRVDLGRLAGVGDVVSATFDGAPVAYTRAGGLLEGTVVVTEGTHRVVVRVVDLVGGERVLTLLVRTPGAGDDPGDGGGSGGGNETAEEPPAPPAPWHKRVLRFFGIPSAAPLLVLAGLAAAALAARRRRA